MRLHSLELQAFQAFAGHERVDFDALAAEGLFLLRGDTGAGKTTVLDAVCFAFYGSLPGVRSTTQMRSHHADPDVRTEVVLEATLSGTRVRITRSPQQERPKRVGDGMTTEGHRVLVEAIDADGSTRVLASSADAANAELDRLLGLTDKQFCQVVLLPQGEFATFLRANSDERKQLLTELFDAGRFAFAEEWLKLRAKRAREDVAQATKSVADIVSRLAEATSEEAPADWGEDPDTLVSWLAERRVVAGAERATAEEVRTRAAEAAQLADAGLQTALALTDRRDRYAAAAALQQELDAQAAIQEARGETLAAARRAAVVVPLLREVAARATTADDLVAAAEKALGRAGSKATDGDDLRDEAAEVRRAIGEAQALAALEAEVVERREVLADARGRYDHSRRTHEEISAWLAAAETQRARLAAAAEDSAAAVAAMRALLADDERRQEQAIAARARDATQHELERHTRARAAAQSAAQAARERWLDLREARLAGMAAEIAGGLAPGEPCAVCGSREHPAPATHSGEPVDAAAEQRARDDHEHQDALRADAEQHVAGATAELAKARALAGAAPVAELVAAAEQARAALEDAQRRAAGADAAARALSEHAAAADHRRGELTRLAAAIAGEEARIATLQRELDVREQRLAQALGETADAAALVAELERRAELLDRAAEAVERARAAVAEAQHARSAADAEAVANGFADADEAHAAARETGAIAALEQQGREYDDRVAQCRAALADPDLRAAAAAAMPDLDALKRAKRETTAALSAADLVLERASRHNDRLAALEQQLATRLDELAPLRDESRRIRELAMLADGTSSANRKRMRLSAYVLAARLEEIAAAASVRLAAMSSGRFTLVHSDEGAKRNRQHGLDLRVVDGWTGRERHPATLSGGETFLASLALALGLADVVCAEAGGARLETLFVDEGFGALDEGALDEVLDVLDRLRDGGRSVGVVSHVPELRQRISAQLQVVKGRTGSHLHQGATSG